MVEAYVLIQAKPGPAGQGVSKDVATIKGMISAEDVSGPYDVIARARPVTSTNSPDRSWPAFNSSTA